MRITKNFSKSEFDSKDGSEMPQDVLANITKLAMNLQILRDYLGVSISINSGYRSPEHNAKVGGKPKSMHLTGMAADIQNSTHSPKQIFDAIEHLQSTGQMMQGGLKAYATFVHYDIRGHYARW